MANKLYKPKKEEIKTHKTGTNFSVSKNGNGKKKSYDEYSKEDFVAEMEQLKKRKKYGLVWEEQEEKFDKDTIGKLPVLKEVKNREIETDKKTPVNLLIEGDNYHSLSVLNYTHEKSVDVIYIDPPYNTGNEDFIYNDGYVEKDDAYRHSKWLSFMHKRLRLAKNLLKSNGIIAISIDDNEFAQLRLLCDDIFGEENLLDVFYIQVRYAGKSLNEKDHFQKLIEQVLLYTKDKQKFIPNKPKTPYDLSKFKFKVIEKGKGQEVNLGGKKVLIFKPGKYEIQKEEHSIDLLKATWASGSVLKGNTSGKFFHDYLEGRKKTDGVGILYKVYGIGEDGLGYRYFSGPKKESTTKGLFYSGVPLGRREELENNGESFKEKPIVNFYDFSGDFGNIRHEGGVDFRSGKKPTRLLKQLINLHTNKNAVVLDFFAGSGSTGHAVLSLNEEDGGSRQFILATNNEGNICTGVCYPRIKNVIRGWNSNKSTGGNLKYFKTAFVDATPTDENKRKLTNQSTEILCVRENTFEAVLDKKDFKIFKNNKQHTGIVFDQTAIPAFKKEVKKIKGPMHTYIFSLEDEDFAPEFADMDGRIVVSPIPEAILRVYRRIFSIKI